MRTPVDAWSFLDSGAQVVMIPPSMVSAMGGNNLMAPATLHITDAGGHTLPVGGAIFISITRFDKTQALSGEPGKWHTCVRKPGIWCFPERQ